MLEKDTCLLYLFALTLLIPLKIHDIYVIHALINPRLGRFLSHPGWSGRVLKLPTAQHAVQVVPVPWGSLVQGFALGLDWFYATGNNHCFLLLWRMGPCVASLFIFLHLATSHIYSIQKIALACVSLIWTVNDCDTAQAVSYSASSARVVQYSSGSWAKEL